MEDYQLTQLANEGIQENEVDSIAETCYNMLLQNIRPENYIERLTKEIAILHEMKGFASFEICLKYCYVNIQENNVTEFRLTDPQGNNEIYMNDYIYNLQQKLNYYIND